MTTATITPELASAAGRAWADLACAGPDPVFAAMAVDRVMEDANVMDVAQVKMALYVATANWLAEANVNNIRHSAWNSTPWAVEGRLRAGHLSFRGAGGVSDPVKSIRLTHSDHERCDRADAALAICRLIESA